MSNFVSEFCYSCGKNGELQRCAGCRHAFCCSRTCQRKHWKKHKPNCIHPLSSLHDLVDACRMDTLPIPSVRCDYGFDNMCDYHGNIPSAESILLGVYQVIMRDIYHLEMANTADSVLSSFGPSKRMIVEAYERNALDEFLHRFIKDVIDRHGSRSPCYCFEWLQNKMVIGPTRLLLSDEVGLTLRQRAAMRNEIYHKYYE